MYYHAYPTGQWNDGKPGFSGDRYTYYICEWDYT